ncbi:MAG TPA: hypothetical protein VFY84_17040 [Jiangellales bacterium]|nr:hypothetical protein [Jiangellales bacterium]
MQVRRWLILVGTAPTLMAVLVVLFVVGDFFGLKDTPAFRVAFAGTAVVSCLVGWSWARRMPVRYAAWSLPVGVGIAMAVWLPSTWPAELTIVVAVTVMLTWAAALVVVSVAAATLAKRSALAATVFAVVGAVAIVALVPIFAVRLGVGAAMVAPASLFAWAPAVLTDEYFSLDLVPRSAAEIASIFAVIVMIGTSYVSGYVVGLGRSAVTPSPAPAAIGPQTAS